MEIKASECYYRGKQVSVDGLSGKIVGFSLPRIWIADENGNRSISKGILVKIGNEVSEYHPKKVSLL